MPEHDLRDISIIGGGPTGLFGAFYAGMFDFTFASTGINGAQITHNSTGSYTVKWPALLRVLSTDHETMLVTAHGVSGTVGSFVFNPVSCIIGGWAYTVFQANVYCRDATGALVDSKFIIALIG